MTFPTPTFTNEIDIKEKKSCLIFLLKDISLSNLCWMEEYQTDSCSIKYVLLPILTSLSAIISVSVNVTTNVILMSEYPSVWI